MSSMTVFSKAVAGSISSEEGAEELTALRAPPSPPKPKWMPQWMHVACMVLFAVVVLPLLDRNQR